MTTVDPADARRADEAPATCIVCRSASPHAFMNIDGQHYWRCGACEARFLDPRQQPGREAERAHYLSHENDPADPRYRRFLSRLSGPLLKVLDASRRGLDYGCGPGPALAAMMAEAGHEMALYDPFFYPDPKPLALKYDFITCTEVAEHFHRPADEFDRLDAMLYPGGWLAIMTCFQTDDARFANWHYRKDPTHVAFYREATFRKIAADRDWSCQCPVKDVVLMRKPGGRMTGDMSNLERDR